MVLTDGDQNGRWKDNHTPSSGVSCVISGFSGPEFMVGAALGPASLQELSRSTIVMLSLTHGFFQFVYAAKLIEYLVTLQEQIILKAGRSMSNLRWGPLDNPRHTVV